MFYYKYLPEDAINSVLSGIRLRGLNADTRILKILILVDLLKFT